MPDPLYTYVSNVYDLVWLGFIACGTVVGYLISNPLYTYTLDIYDFIWLVSFSNDGFGIKYPNKVYMSVKKESITKLDNQTHFSVYK